MDRAPIVHETFLRRVRQNDYPEPRSTTRFADVDLSRDMAIGLFRSQCVSRQLDRISRKMQADGEGFYTIGSSGHEGNAAIAAAFRADDMAFLHYRDCAFLVERARKAGEKNILRDLLLSFAASREDPVSGGRHKVLGSKSLYVPPQTSTIASHLPKAMGAAYSIGLSKRVTGGSRTLAKDGVIICSFGDASLNHSTAQGAINTAGWAAYQNVAMPIVFICEDNGIGISVKTPTGWIEASMRHRPGLTYIACDGHNLADTYRAATEASAIARQSRKPVFLHFKCTRLFGHAGADAQSAYLTQSEIEDWEALDPLIQSAQKLSQEYGLSADEILFIYNDIEHELEKLIPEIVASPKLSHATEIGSSIVPPSRKAAPPDPLTDKDRAILFGADLAAMEKPQPMNRLINWALTDLMARHGEIVVAGEDVGRKGGVYGITQKLQQRFGANRIIDTLLDEQSILGMAIGLAHNGYVPIPEIQFLAYLHNAEDQLRGEAATLPFFSQGQFCNPMVVRIAGLGYQRGFGGHFHNDNSIAVLRDIPGLVIACPSRGADAAMMLRECVRLAREENRVCVFLEPIALYPMRDLHNAKDGGWMDLYPTPDARLDIGQVGVVGDGQDVALVTYGNGRYLAQRAQTQLAEKNNIGVRVIDIRWLAPLPLDAIIQAIRPCRSVAIVDECRGTGSQSEAIYAGLREAGISVPMKRLTAYDTFIPLGPAATAPLPSVETIMDLCMELSAAPRH